MGIYILNMKMPDDCRECRFQEFHDDTGLTVCHANNYILSEGRRAMPFDGRPVWCPLIEIESHGRLIDVDGLEPDTEWDAMTDGYVSYSQLAIDCAETVLDPEN